MNLDIGGVRRQFANYFGRRQRFEQEHCSLDQCTGVLANCCGEGRPAVEPIWDPKSRTWDPLGLQKGTRNPTSKGVGCPSPRRLLRRCFAET
jgi:hypothetical protein